MATITQLTGSLDANGKPILIVPFSNYVLAKSLAAGVAESFTVPAGAEYVIFSATGDFYAKANGTATVPGDVTDGTAAELNPTARTCSPAGTISVIAPAAVVVTAAFYTRVP